MCEPEKLLSIFRIGQSINRQRAKFYLFLQVNTYIVAYCQRLCIERDLMRPARKKIPYLMSGCCLSPSPSKYKASLFYLILWYNPIDYEKSHHQRHKFRIDLIIRSTHFWSILEMYELQRHKALLTAADLNCEKSDSYRTPYLQILSKHIIILPRKSLFVY